MQNSSSSVNSNVIEAPNGNFIMTGFIHDTINQCDYLCIAASDAQGNFLWKKKYGNSKFTYLDNILTPRGAIYKDLSAFYYAVGVRDSNNYQLGALIKFDYSGDTLWQKLYREVYPKDVIVQGLTKSIDNGFLITGASQDPTGVSCLLIKTDISGKELWRKRIAKPTPNIHDGKSIVQDTATKKIVIVGYQSIGTATTWDTYSNILILDSLGNNQVQTTFNNASGGSFSWIKQLNDKYFLTGGGFYDHGINNAYYYKSILIKFDLNGTVIWSKKYTPVSDMNGISDGFELKNGDLFFIGNVDYYYSKMQVWQTDKNGIIKWQKYIGSSSGADNPEFLEE